MRPADRALLRRLDILGSARMFLVIDNLCDFRNDVAAALDLDVVADLHAESADLVHVVKSCITNRCPPDSDWRQFGDGSQFPGASDLPANVLEPGDAGASRVFEGDGPPRSFAGEAEFVL